MTRLDPDRISARRRYIIRHGVVPWGALAGIGAAVTVVRGAANDHSGGGVVGTYTLVALGVVCLVMWTAIVGWVVGVFLWETRGRQHEPQTRPAKRL